MACSLAHRQLGLHHSKHRLRMAPGTRSTTGQPPRQSKWLHNAGCTARSNSYCKPRAQTARILCFHSTGNVQSGGDGKEAPPLLLEISCNAVTGDLSLRVYLASYAFSNAWLTRAPRQRTSKREPPSPSFYRVDELDLDVLAGWPKISMTAPSSCQTISPRFI